MRSRTLLLIALVALLDATTTVPALAAAPSEVTLEINENCNGFTDWPCWTLPGGSPKYAERVTVAGGGKLVFDDKTTFSTDVVWTEGSPTSCPGVPSTLMSGWESSCEFTQAGTYKFESAKLFIGTGYYANDNYTKYEVVVAGPPTPTATTDEATGVEETKATLNGSVNPEGQATSYYFDYGASTAYGEKTTELSVGNDSNNHAEHQSVTTVLAPGTMYHFRIVATYGSGKKTFGNDQTFMTASPPGPPSATTETATGVTQTEATLRGTVNPDGKPTKYFFEWGMGTNYGEKTAEVPVGQDHTLHAASASLTTLLAGTVYHFRIVATNGSETVHGGDQMFTTNSSPPPSKEPSPTSPPTGGNPTSPTTTPQVTSTTTVQEKATKSLTRTQKLAKALKQCKKQPKRKRAKCEATAKKLYASKHKGRKK